MKKRTIRVTITRTEQRQHDFDVPVESLTPFTDAKKIALEQAEVFDWGKATRFVTDFEPDTAVEVKDGQ